MTIEANDLLEGLWFMSFDEFPQDWLGGLSRHVTKPDHFEFIYRHRYYNDDDLTRHSKDRKSWYRAELGPCDLQEALSKAALLVRIVCELRKSKMWQCLRQGRTTDAMMEEWASMPHVHIEQLSSEEFEKVRRGDA